MIDEPMFRDLGAVMAFIRSTRAVISVGALSGMQVTSHAKAKERIEGEVETAHRGTGLRDYDRAAQAGMIIGLLGRSLSPDQQLHLVAAYGSARESGMAVTAIVNLEMRQVDHPRNMVAAVVRRFYGGGMKLAEVAKSAYPQLDQRKAVFKGYHCSSVVGSHLTSLMASAESRATAVLREAGIIE